MCADDGLCTPDRTTTCPDRRTRRQRRVEPALSGAWQRAADRDRFAQRADRYRCVARAISGRGVPARRLRHDGTAVAIRSRRGVAGRSEEPTSELQSLMRISYAVFCLKKKTNNKKNKHTT